MEWISVKDRLPDNKEMVLIYCPTLKHRNKKNNIKTGRKINFGCGLRPEGCLGYDDDSTHWMPLPEPPKEK